VPDLMVRLMMPTLSPYSAARFPAEHSTDSTKPRWKTLRVIGDEKLSAATGATWRYIRVDQSHFDPRKPTALSHLADSAH
jgi:hypothetical protein